jgi:hypothetical protein
LIASAAFEETVLVLIALQFDQGSVQVAKWRRGSRTDDLAISSSELTDHSVGAFTSWWHAFFVKDKLEDKA